MMCSPCGIGESPPDSAEEGPPPRHSMHCSPPPRFASSLADTSHHDLTAQTRCLSLMKSLISSNLLGPPLRGVWAHLRTDWYRELVITSFVWPTHHHPSLSSSAATPEPGHVVKWKNKMSVYSLPGALSHRGEIFCLLQRNEVGGNSFSFSHSSSSSGGD